MKDLFAICYIMIFFIFSCQIVGNNELDVGIRSLGNQQTGIYVDGNDHYTFFNHEDGLFIVTTKLNDTLNQQIVYHENGEVATISFINSNTGYQTGKNYQFYEDHGYLYSISNFNDGRKIGSERFRVWGTDRPAKILYHEENGEIREVYKATIEEE